MAKSILSKTLSQKTKKTELKLNNSTSAPTSSERQKQEEASIPIYQEELFRLHDITDSLKLLSDVAQESPEMQLIQVEIVIKKVARCAWDLTHEELDSRWADAHPDVDWIRND